MPCGRKLPIPTLCKAALSWRPLYFSGSWLEKLNLEAEDRELIAKLATDKKKRVFFARMAVQLRSLAHDVEDAIKLRAAKG